MRRVPKSCRGYCSGFWPIRSMARSSSSRNIPAARLLRCVPINGRLSFFQCSRVDSERLDAHRSSRLRRRFRAALQETNSTAPSSICFIRSSISRFQASVEPSSTVASRLSIRESISADRASAGRARASRSSSAGWLSMNRFYRAHARGPDSATESKGLLPINAVASPAADLGGLSSFGLIKHPAFADYGGGERCLHPGCALFEIRSTLRHNVGRRMDSSQCGQRCSRAEDFARSVVGYYDTKIEIAVRAVITPRDGPKTDPKDTRGRDDRKPPAVA